MPLILIGVCLLLPQPAQAGTENPAFLGSKTCAPCHAEQYDAWQGSHHDLAMQEASRITVLGDFDNANFTSNGVTSTFSVRDGRFMVRTDGPDGKLQDYPVRYTFGVEPLQQYLVEFPGGRLQALSVAWDTRPHAEGGQRWFHLYPGEKITHADELHWTQPAQNWNSMCAECHSTNLAKNYDPVTGTFSTTWSEIDVSCEACHGPGSNHVQWAEHAPGREASGPDKGLVVRLDERKDVRWTIDAGTGNAVRSRIRDSAREIGVCARCHSRRSPISSHYRHGEPFLDHYRPRLLDEGMYYPDGQIDGEVYVYGSFLQSRMYHEGVTCSDCHEPHSRELRSPVNGACLQCHAAAKYDRTSHHFHPPGSPGASCAECHMPPRTYMVVDPRHDHSMRIPRPDLSEALGTPNACTNCHTDRDARWATEHLQEWYPGPPRGYQHYAEALAAGRNGKAGAGRLLATLVRDRESPAIARATGLSIIAPYLDATTIDTLDLGLADTNPLLRIAALESLQSFPPEVKFQAAFSLLEDPVRAVRIEAARVLSDLPAEQLDEPRKAVLDSATAEFIAAQQAMAERPEAQTNLGNLYTAQGKLPEAVAAYRKAMELEPAFIPAYVNLADLYRARGEEAEAEEVLRRALAIAPGNAEVQHALGLCLVRQNRNREAVEMLGQASRGAPDNARYVYVYAVALHATGNAQQALAILEGAQSRFPDNTDILSALVAFYRDGGDTEAARRYADRLRALMP